MPCVANFTIMLIFFLSSFWHNHSAIGWRSEVTNSFKAATSDENVTTEKQETPFETSIIVDDESPETTQYVSKKTILSTVTTEKPETTVKLKETPFETTIIGDEKSSETTLYETMETLLTTVSTEQPDTSDKQKETSFVTTIIGDDESSKTTPYVSRKTTISTVTTEQTDGGDNSICEDENPCKNGGTCEPKDGKTYKCICIEGFNGRNCEAIDWCYINKDICGATPCLYDDNTGSGFCYCKEDLYFNAKSQTCEELDKCLLARIKGNCSGDHETCDKKGDCICEDNYAYNDDRSACEPDFCWKKLNKSRCGINMECTEDETFSCFCKNGYRQIDEKCVKVDKCAPGLSNCQQACLDGNCSCFRGFSEKEDGTCDPSSDSECNKDCGTGFCVKDGVNEKCICPQISHVYKENTCIDQCKAKMLKKGECPEEVGCMSDDEHGYTCNCSGKYDFAEDGVHCIAKRMCSEGDGIEACSLKGGLCEDNFAITEGYECICKFGYKENSMTGVCEHMCETADCDKYQALCTINVTNQVECICPPLLVKDTFGRCSQLAKYSYLGDFSVPRNKYQVITTEPGGRIRRDTREDINYVKLLKDFQDSMNNIFDGYEGTSVLNCTDEGDDWKCFLEIKLSKDPKGKINIVSTPSVCLPIADDPHCLIPPEFITGRRTADDEEVFHKTDPCDKGVIGKLCGDDTECKVTESTGFKCECKKGYLRRTSFVPAQNVLIDVCEDVDECLNLSICPNTTTCSNLPGDYTCKCKVGYRLEEGKSGKSDGCRAVCNPNPCVHGTCSETGRDGFSCSCEGLYSGRFCNQTNNDITDIMKKGNQTAGIVGGVLGAFLVMAITVCIILFRRHQKHKSIDDIEDFVRQRKRGLAFEMSKLGRRQLEHDDVELIENDRGPYRKTKNKKFNTQNPANPKDSMSDSSPHLEPSTGKSVDGEDDML